VSYIDRVESIAESLAAGLAGTEPPSWNSLRLCWATLEAYAAAMGYDVLRTWMKHGDTEMHVALRENAQKMVTLLYQLESEPSLAAAVDAIQLREKDDTYGTSWKARGGAGAFFVTVRKWDRLVNQMKKFKTLGELLAVDWATDAEGPWDDVHDLRGYLLLWLAELEENPIRAPEVA
jgi:hypothetical protein